MFTGFVDLMDHQWSAEKTLGITVLGIQGLQIRNLTLEKSEGNLYLVCQPGYSYDGIPVISFVINF
jgi:hypothetical protein